MSSSTVPLGPSGVEVGRELGLPADEGGRLLPGPVWGCVVGGRTRRVAVVASRDRWGRGVDAVRAAMLLGAAVRPEDLVPVCPDRLSHGYWLADLSGGAATGERHPPWSKEFGARVVYAVTVEPLLGGERRVVLCPDLLAAMTTFRGQDRDETGVRVVSRVRVRLWSVPLGGRRTVAAAYAESRERLRAGSSGSMRSARSSVLADSAATGGWLVGISDAERPQRVRPVSRHEGWRGADRAFDRLRETSPPWRRVRLWRLPAPASASTSRSPVRAGSVGWEEGTPPAEVEQAVVLRDTHPREPLCPACWSPRTAVLPGGGFRCDACWLRWAPGTGDSMAGLLRGRAPAPVRWRGLSVEHQ